MAEPGKRVLPVRESERQFLKVSVGIKPTTMHSQCHLDVTKVEATMVIV
jgi:hypothetical protein